MTSPRFQLDPIWLRRRDCRIVPLNSSLSNAVAAVGLPIRCGVRAYPDLRRPDFYDIELDDGWAYVHVLDGARVVYLVAYSSYSPFIHSQPRSPETNDEGIDENVHV
jgi:hypothetical protein